MVTKQTNRRTTRRILGTTGALAALAALATVAPAAVYAQEPRDAAPAAGATPVIDILVLYTPQAKQDAGGEAQVRRIAEKAATYTNQAFTNSQVNARTRIAAVLPAPDYNPAGKAESTAAYDYLADIPDTARRLRDTHRGDVNALFASDVGGFSTSSPRPITKESGERGNMMLLGHDRTDGEPDYLTHELGHLMGLTHDRAESGDPGDGFDYGRGFIAPSMKWRDIMAYEDACEAAGKKCPVIPYFSNPRLTYQGEALGIPVGQPGEADAARLLNETAPIVAAYR